MTRQVLQLRRGTQSEIATFTGANGEVTVDTTRKTLVVHDGTTVGGSTLATLASPTFTGTVIAPTPLTADNSTKVATTAYVVAKLTALTYPSVGSDAVTEGSTNLYFTNARARSAISVSGNLNYSNGVISYTTPTAISAFTNDVGYVTNASLRGQLSGSGSINYNQSTGVISYTESVSSVNGKFGDVTLTSSDVAEGSRLYYTDTRARTAMAASTGLTYTVGTGTYALTNTSVTVNSKTLSLLTSGSVTLNTDDVAQGTTNKYFSNTLARGAVSAGTGLSYDSGTGIFSVDATATETFAAITVDTTSLVVDKTNHRVGILTATPSYSLDVRGDINVTGSLRSNGTVGTPRQVLSTNGALNVTAASGDGTTVTLTFAAQTVTPHAVGGQISVTGISPAGYNGNYVVTAASTTSVSYSSAINSTSTPYVSGGIIAGVTWSNLTAVLPDITELDDLGYYFDGGTYSFAPTNNGNSVTIVAPIALQAALNGATQQPYINKSNTLWQSAYGKYGDYTIDSNGLIVFASPPQPGDKLNARVLVGNVSNPIDKTYPYRAIDITTGF